MGKELSFVATLRTDAKGSFLFTVPKDFETMIEKGRKYFIRMVDSVAWEKYCHGDESLEEKQQEDGK